VICPHCYAHIADGSLSCPTCGAQFDLNGNVTTPGVGAPAKPHPHPHHEGPAPSLTPVVALASGRNRARRITTGVVIVAVLAGAGYGVVRWRRAETPGVAQWASPPRPVPGLPSGGLGHTCVITEAGTVLCWGDREFGQLGDTVGAPTGVPCAVCTNATFTQLDAGDNHTCARTTQGGVLCWGANYRGQLGLPSNTECVTGRGRYACSVVPQEAPVERVTMVAAGADHTCALLADSTVACWGGSYRGQLGVVSMAPGQIIARPGSRFRYVTIAAGAYHTCGITPTGELQCWGYNVNGQIGTTTRQLCGATLQSRVPCAAQPVTVTGGHTFRAVAAGVDHTCALDQDGRAWCWGKGDFGQLGAGGPASSEAPVAVEGNRSYVALAAGARFTCALDGEGGAWCWGENTKGQLGRGSDSSMARAPAKVTIPVRALSIGAGAEHACVVAEGGRAFCWGAGLAGQLGTGAVGDSRVPLEAGLDRH
jgi:alpha-tubulin suppressor-like RCC1 family protein